MLSKTILFFTKKVGNPYQMWYSSDFQFSVLPLEEHDYTKTDKNMIDNFITLNGPKAIEVFFLTIQSSPFPQGQIQSSMQQI